MLYVSSANKLMTALFWESIRGYQFDMHMLFSTYTTWVLADRYFSLESFSLGFHTEAMRWFLQQLSSFFPHEDKTTFEVRNLPFFAAFSIFSPLFLSLLLKSLGFWQHIWGLLILKTSCGLNRTCKGISPHVYLLSCLCFFGKTKTNKTKQTPAQWYAFPLPFDPVLSLHAGLCLLAFWTARTGIAKAGDLQHRAPPAMQVLVPKSPLWVRVKAAPLLVDMCLQQHHSLFLLHLDCFHPAFSIDSLKPNKQNQTPTLWMQLWNFRLVDCSPFGTAHPRSTLIPGALWTLRHRHNSL